MTAKHAVMIHARGTLSLNTKIAAYMKLCNTPISPDAGGWLLVLHFIYLLYQLSVHPIPVTDVSVVNTILTESDIPSTTIVPFPHRVARTSSPSNTCSNDEKCTSCLLKHVKCKQMRNINV